jgi:hypothetical protein
MRKLLAMTTVGFLLGAGTTAAATGWRVVGKGSATGEFATAQAQATVKNPAAVAFRSTAGDAEVIWSMACSGTTKARKGVVYVMGAGRSSDCTVSILGSEGGSRVSVQVLAKRR